MSEYEPKEKSQAMFTLSILDAHKQQAHEQL